jgi:cephalosporin hydroxylase
LGRALSKFPTDLMIYQEILTAVRPDIIIECGTGSGGSALFLASICDLLGKGRILTVDITKWPNRPEHPRIKYLVGSSIDPSIVNAIKKEIKSNDIVLVILDSDHSKTHVLNEMTIYSSLVTKSSYLIVEDSNINGNPVYDSFGPGPWEAIQEFLETHDNFIIDFKQEKYLLTANPGGYLKKIRK